MAKKNQSKKKKQAARLLALSKPKSLRPVATAPEKSPDADRTMQSHEERGQAMISESQQALKVIMHSRFAAMSELVESTSTTQIEFANMARDMGRDIQIITTNYQSVLLMEINSGDFLMIARVINWFKSTPIQKSEEHMENLEDIVYVMEENQYRISNKDCLRITMVLSHYPDNSRHALQSNEEIYITPYQYKMLPEALKRFFKPHQIKGPVQ